MPFTPLFDRIVIKRLDPVQKTAGGVLLPDNAQEDRAEGIVLTVGAGGVSDAGTIIPLTVKPGDKVLFGKWSGTEIKVDGEDVLIMKESDVLGVLT